MSEVNRAERLIGAVARGLTGYSGSVLPILGAACLATAPFLMPKIEWLGWWLVWIGIALTIGGIIGLIALKPNYWALRDKHEKLKSDSEKWKSDSAKLEEQLRVEQTAHKASLFAMLNHVARRALREAAPDTEPDRCRISVYVVRERQFVLVARWSQNERLRQLGREQFDMSQGLIGQAWEGKKGAAQVESLKGDEEEWIHEQCSAYGFDEATARRMTMKSRSLAVVRVDGERKTPIIVVESLDPKLLGLKATVALKHSEPFNEVARIVSDPDIIIPRAHETVPLSVNG